MIPMRDGVRLATDLFLPAVDFCVDPGPHPVLLERTPYDKEDPALVATAKRLARHGYVVALQDVRGRFRSEGDWQPFTQEDKDGYDTVEWVGDQPWCVGRVGTMGLSYTGSDQHALATLNPPHLSAMFVAEGMSNYHTCAMRHGGAAELRWVYYAFTMAHDSPAALADKELRAAVEHQMARLHDLLERMPLKRGATVLRRFPTIEQWLHNILTHGAYDDYWRQRGYNAQAHYAEHADVPVYHLSGWYDTYPRATTDNYVALSECKTSRQQLILGPWRHGVQHLAHTYAGDVDFGSESALDYDALRLRFFDETLKGLDTGMADEAPVRIFVMGGGSGRRLRSGRIDHGGRWREERAWPLTDVQEQTLFLHPDGALRPAPADTTCGATTYRFDPADPVPTIGGGMSSADEILPPGGFDQRHRPGLWGCTHDLPLNIRQDVLTFVTEPLRESVEVTGRCLVRLWVSSTAADTDFTAKLIDVYPPTSDYPDGYALLLQDSIIRMRYRADPCREVFMEPDHIYPIDIELYPTSNLFVRGHAIRVDISSSNFPRFDVNLNDGGPLWRSRIHRTAENTVHHSQEHPSCVRLPVAPARDGAPHGAAARSPAQGD